MTREEIAAAEERHDRDHYGCRKHPAIRAECDQARALAGNRAYLDLVEHVTELERQLAEAREAVVQEKYFRDLDIEQLMAAETKLRAVAALRGELRAATQASHLSADWDRGRRHARIAVADRLDAILGGDT